MNYVMEFLHEANEVSNLNKKDLSNDLSLFLGGNWTNFLSIVHYVMEWVKEANNETGSNRKIKKKNPEGRGPSGLESYSQQSSYKSAPCIKSLIVCCIPSAYSFRRHPSGVLDPILVY